jgi:parvulin-like peptidyl-prolyl isomerase
MHMPSVFDFNQAHAARSFTLLGLGAILGLGMAGVSLFTAPGTSTLIVAPADVAVVNQRSVSRIDFDAQLKTLYDVSPTEATPAQRKEVLEAMIREEIFVQRGVELDVAGVDPATRAALVAAVEQQIVADAQTRQPSGEDLESYYKQNQAKYMSEGTMIVLDLVAETPDQAAGAVQALRAKAPLETAVAKFHLRDSGKTKGEEFYFAAKIHLGDTMFAFAQKLGPGDVSAPLPQSDGVHLLVMIKNAAPVAIDFTEARARVLSDWRQDNSARLLRGDEAFLRKRANVLIAEDLR